MTNPRLDGLLDAFAAAVVGGDRAVLESLLDPDFEFVSAQGRVFTRDQRLDALTSGALARLEFTTDRRVREWGPTAILRARFAAEFQPNAAGVRIDQGVASFMLLRRGEGWGICHQHNSHVDAE